MEWQHIETVPPNILVLIWDGFDVCIARSIRGEWISFGCDGPAVQHQDDFGTSYQEPGKPTHWMKMPDPPAINAEERGGYDVSIKQPDLHAPGWPELRFLGRAETDGRGLWWYNELMDDGSTKKHPLQPYHYNVTDGEHE